MVQAAVILLERSNRTWCIVGLRLNVIQKQMGTQRNVIQSACVQCVYACNMILAQCWLTVIRTEIISEHEDMKCAQFPCEIGL